MIYITYESWKFGQLRNELGISNEGGKPTNPGCGKVECSADAECDGGTVRGFDTAGRERCIGGQLPESLEVDGGRKDGLYGSWKGREVGFICQPGEIKPFEIFWKSVL